jgi:outer membrane protein TolC
MKNILKYKSAPLNSQSFSSPSRWLSEARRGKTRGKVADFKVNFFPALGESKRGFSMLKYLFILFILISITPVKVFSRQQDSLYNYLELAAKNNPTIRQRFTEYKAALQKIPQAGSLSDPQLDIGVFLSPMELVNGKQAADIRLMQMFPWFGVLRNAKDEMSQMANARFEEFRDARLQVYYELQSTWFELYRIRNDIGISEKNLDILKTIERISLIRYKTAPTVSSSGQGGTQSNTQNVNTSANAPASSGMSGMTGNQGTVQSSRQQVPMQQGSMVSSQGGGLSDLYRIRIETGDLENSIALLRNLEQTVTARFNGFLNRRPAIPVFTPDTLVSDSLGIGLEAASDSINSNNPMLKMIEFERRSYDAKKKMVTGMGYPMVGLGLNYSVINNSEMAASPSMNGKDMVMPMVSITLPIYRKKYDAMKKEADLLGEAASQNYQATVNSLQTQYYEAVQQFQDAKRRVKLYSDQYQLASKSLEIMLKSFSAGSSGLTDVMRIRQQTLDYEMNRIQAVVDLNSAIALLKRLMSSTQIK